MAQPWTCNPVSDAHLQEIDCQFPAILKPAVKTQLNRFTRAKAWRVENRQQLVARYEEACKLVPPQDILLQELIPGNGQTQFSFAGLCQDGQPLAWVVARRTRQYPIDFGRSSSFVVTAKQPDVEQAARHILAEMRFSGLIEAEFKLDPRDNRYKLLELNPRVWGWHTLGRLAQVDFPYLLWRMALGKAMPVQRSEPPAGLGWIHTIPNAAVLTAGLLYGDGDFTRTITLTVRGGLDTDSNGATAGSVAGVLTGADAIPAQWKEPLEDTVRSAVFGFDGVRISELAERTVQLAETEI